MPNEKRGEVHLAGVGVIRFDWDAIANLKAQFGDNFDQAVSDAVQSLDVTAMSEILAAGTTAMTAAQIRKASPPVMEAGNAILTALNLAFHGERKAPPAKDDGTENPT